MSVFNSTAPDETGPRRAPAPPLEFNRCSGESEMSFFEVKLANKHSILWKATLLIFMSFPSAGDSQRQSRNFGWLKGMRASNFTWGHWLSKTFTMANVIVCWQADARHCSQQNPCRAERVEYKNFPDNAVHYLYRTTTTISQRRIPPILYKKMRRLTRNWRDFVTHHAGAPEKT